MRKLLTIGGIALVGWGLSLVLDPVGAAPGAASAPLILTVAPPAGAPMTGPMTGTARVIDGDTFDLAGTRIRLHGVDAPERGATCQDARGRDWDCGTWATAQLRALLTTAPLACHDLGERTRARVVARCALGGQDLGGLLVGEGVVRACPRFARQHPHARGYEALEARAIAARAGLHAGTTPPLPDFCRTDRTAPAPIPAAAEAGNCRIKGNISRSGERIFHVPAQRDYEGTRIATRSGERWFCSEAEAIAAGWRSARR